MNKEEMILKIKEYQKKFGMEPFHTWNNSRLPNWEYSLLFDLGIITQKTIKQLESFVLFKEAYKEFQKRKAKAKYAEERSFDNLVESGA